MAGLPVFLQNPGGPFVPKTRARLHAISLSASFLWSDVGPWVFRGHFVGGLGRNEALRHHNLGRCCKFCWVQKSCTVYVQVQVQRSLDSPHWLGFEVLKVFDNDFPGRKLDVDCTICPHCRMCTWSSRGSKPCVFDTDEVGQTRHAVDPCSIYLGWIFGLQLLGKPGLLLVLFFFV